jgi:hypothetical protein
MTPPIHISFDAVNPHTRVYRNKTACFELMNCVIDLRNFGKHAEHHQNANIQVYSNGRRIRKYINRRPSVNCLWYDERYPTLDYEVETMDPSISPDHTIDEMFFCYDPLEWQYSHFLTDVLPKFWYYIELKKTNPNLKVGQIRPIVNFAYNLNDKTLKTKMNVVSEFAHEATDFYLGHHGYGDELCPLQVGKVYFVKRMIVPVPFTSQDVKNWPDVQHAIYSLFEEEANRRVTTEYPEKIYISRQDTQKSGWFNLRHCVNETEIISRLETEGFKSVELMPLSLFEKIKVFNSGRTIVQAVGSNCFNMVFCRPRTRLVTLVHPYYESWCDGLNNLADYKKCFFEPWHNGIELLGLDGYPNNYVRIPDQPWRFSMVDELVRHVR